MTWVLLEEACWSWILFYPKKKGRFAGGCPTGWAIIMRMLKPTILLSLAMVLLGAFTPARPAVAQTAGAQDLINAVNALRAANGLSPYVVDGDLMAYAQQHSDYQASTGQSTHTHADGTVPWSHGIQENIAVGMSLTPDIAVNYIWSDAIHMKTMVGFQGGAIGAGVAFGGGQLYYTIDVRPEGAASSIPLSPVSSLSPLTQATPAATALQVVPVITSTPQADGSIVHVVAPGQALLSIAVAYGVKVAEIRAFNNLAEGSVVIYPNQKLVIRKAAPPTVTPTTTATPLPPTRPPRPTHDADLVKTASALVTRTPLPIPAAEAAPVFGGSSPIAFVLIGVCLAGLLAVGVNILRSK